MKKLTMVEMVGIANQLIDEVGLDDLVFGRNSDRTTKEYIHDLLEFDYEEYKNFEELVEITNRMTEEEAWEE